MEDYQITTVNHPLFGEIMISQDAKGNMLYRAKEVCQYYGINPRSFPKEIHATLIPVNVVNNFGYQINIHMRFLTFYDIIQLLIIGLSRDVKKCIKDYKEYTLELNKKVRKKARKVREAVDDDENQNEQ